MDLSLILTLAGLFVTLILGLWSIYLAIRQKYPGQLVFVLQDSIGLFDSIVKNLPGLSVLYRDRPVKDNLVLLKGAILNSGRMDVSDTLVHEPLKFRLPAGYRWVATTIVSASPKVLAAATIMSNAELKFDLGLFRRGEYVRFEALVEVSDEHDRSDASSPEVPAERLIDVLDITHRIADTGKVSRLSIPERISGRRINRRPEFVIALLTTILIFTYIAASIRPESYLNYEYLLPNGSTIDVTATAGKNDKIVLHSTDGTFKDTISFDLFVARSKPKLARIDWKAATPIFSFLLLLLVVATGFTMWPAYRERRIRSLLKLDNRPDNRVAESRRAP